MRDVTLKEIRETNKEKVIGEFLNDEGNIDYKKLIEEEKKDIKNGLYVIRDFETEEDLFAFYLKALNLNVVIKTFCNGRESGLVTYNNIHKEIKKLYKDNENKKLLLTKIELDNLDEEVNIIRKGISWRKTSIPIKKGVNGEIKVIDREEKSYKYNRIVYGAPGTGKSYMLEKDGEIFKTNISIKKEENINGKRYWLVRRE